jgi:RNA polymerase sigma factor (sigma-70 family)
VSENVIDDRVDPAPGVEVLDAGGARGFDGLFDRYYARAVRLAYLTGAGDQARAQHVAADALARVWIKWRARTIDDFWPYLRVAVVNELRSNARRARLAERHDQQQRAVVLWPADDAQIVERDAVASALAQLPPRQRTALVLRYFEDLSHEECAKVMGCSVGTAKSTSARALVALRAVLEGQDDD